MGTHKIRVNNTLEFDLTADDITQLDIIQNGTTSKFHVLQNQISYHTEVLSSDFNAKTYTVEVNNTSYDVIIADTLDQQIATMGFSIGASKQVNSIKSPMPGLIIDIQVEVGQIVKEDDYLLVLEAMKMENIITSPREGVIKSIAVAKGDAVDKGKLLIEFE